MSKDTTPHVMPAANNGLYPQICVCYHCPMRIILWLVVGVGLGSAILRAEDRPPVVSLAFEGNFENKGAVPFTATACGDDVKIVPVDGGQVVWIGGTEDWIDVAVDDRLSFEKGATLELWFCRSDWLNPYQGGSGWQTVASVDGLCLNITAPGCPSHVPWTLEGSVGSYVTNRASVCTTSAPGLIRPGRWYHVALVYDAADQTATLYLDGETIARKQGAPSLVGKRVNPLRIGTWYKANQAFRGWIENLRLYDYPRSASQVRAVVAGPPRISTPVDQP